MHVEQRGDEERIKQNLIDAGCSAATISGFFAEADWNRRLKLLRDYRCALLDSVHKRQAEIDCLDYLVQKMEKQRKKGG